MSPFGGSWPFRKTRLSSPATTTWSWPSHLHGYLEPENRDLDAYMSNYEPDCVRSLLRDEFKVNPYMRFNDPKLIEILKKRGLPVDTEWERWQSLMAIEE